MKASRRLARQMCRAIVYAGARRKNEHGAAEWIAQRVMRPGAGSLRKAWMHCYLASLGWQPPASAEHYHEHKFPLNERSHDELH